jgi:dihydrofolate reductase
MARLVFSMGASLDGFVEDPNGDIGFSAPAEDVHRLANEEAREAGAFLFGRRLFEVMEPYWPDAVDKTDIDEVEREFAREYVKTPRIVFSDTLESVPEGVRLVRSDQAIAEVTRLKEQPGADLHVGGPTLAASLFDLIDEFRLFVHPVLVGGGKPFFPTGHDPAMLRLVESRPLSHGVLHLRYERS